MTNPSLRRARKALVDNLIAALRDRPETFTADMNGSNHKIYRLVDTVSKQHWWIASGYWFFRLDDRTPGVRDDLKLGGWNRTRGYWAYLRWKRRHWNAVAAGPKSITAQQAEILWAANQEYLKQPHPGD